MECVCPLRVCVCVPNAKKVKLTNVHQQTTHAKLGVTDFFFSFPFCEVVDWRLVYGLFLFTFFRRDTSLHTKDATTRTY